MIPEGRSNALGFQIDAGVDGPQAETTGRYVVVFAQGDGAVSHADILESVTGLSNIVDGRDFDAKAMGIGQTETADATMFAELGVAVVTADPDQLVSLQTAASEQGTILSVEPELVYHILAESGGVPVEYLRGYRDGITDLSGRVFAGAGAEGAGAAAATYRDTAQFSWGLQATGVTASSRTGRGVRVAVLDTGLDLAHPDFSGRNITSQSFVPGAQPQDGHGHGTHCVGTACGPQAPSGTRRYGVAFEADIYAGKVLSDQGRGTDSGILAGIDWAINNGCHVISMSLGADVRQVSQAYETVGQRALAAGSLIVAAAGNNAHRPGDPGFVGRPANSPSIMAVGAVDSQLGMAWFSGSSTSVNGGQVDIAGPGVDVYSSWPLAKRYNTISGTSMACPHVAGIAALWCEATGHGGRALWSTVIQHAMRLPLPSVDVGTGLVQAPG